VRSGIVVVVEEVLASMDGGVVLRETARSYNDGKWVSSSRRVTSLSYNDGKEYFTLRH